jgi:hypothetical protein
VDDTVHRDVRVEDVPSSRGDAGSLQEWLATRLVPRGAEPCTSVLDGCDLVHYGSPRHINARGVQ